MITVTRLGSGPALVRAARSRERRRGGWGALFGTLAVLLALLVAAPAFAQAVPTPPPGVGDAVDRALGQLGQQGGTTGQSGSLSLSLQVLIIMGLLTILPGILLMMTIACYQETHRALRLPLLQLDQDQLTP